MPCGRPYVATEEVDLLSNMSEERTYDTLKNVILRPVGKSDEIRFIT